MSFQLFLEYCEGFGCLGGVRLVIPPTGYSERERPGE